MSEETKKFGRRAVGGQKFCHICGEKANSYNYGGISCHCCKSFFRHAVLNKLFPKYNCKYEENCVMSKETRKKCKKCRFQKCLKIGMEQEWVFIDGKENSKVRKMSNDSEEKPLQNNSSDDSTSSVLPSVVELTSDEIAKVENLNNYYKIACESIPYNFPNKSENETINMTKAGIMIIGIMSTAFRRLVCFAKMIPEFQKLPAKDQATLLKHCILQITLLRCGLTFDVENGTIFPKGANAFEKYPQLSLHEVRHLLPSDLLDMHVTFYERLQDLQVDENCVTLLSLIVMFSDFEKVEDEIHIDLVQEYYTDLLQRYLLVKFGNVEGRKIFAKLLGQLVELRQVGELHQGLPLNLSDTQVNKIHQVVFNLQTSQKHHSQYVDNNFQQNPVSLSKSSIGISMRTELFDETELLPPDENHNLMHLFRSAANISGDFSIKPIHFSNGPHIPVEKAFMRRIPQLLNNPLDPLLPENVGTYNNSCNTAQTQLIKNNNNTCSHYTQSRLNNHICVTSSN